MKDRGYGNLNADGFGLWKFGRNTKPVGAEREHRTKRGGRNGVALDTVFDWALDILFMVLFLVLVMMTTLAYGI